MSLAIYPETAGLDVTYETAAGCGCPICFGSQAPDGSAGLMVDAGGTVQLDAQGFLLDVSNPLSGLVGTTMPNGLRILSSYESAVQIARPATWASFDADLELTFSVSADGVAAGFAFDPAFQEATRRVFSFYEDISGLRFREIPAGSAETPNLKLYNIDQRGGGGWAELPGSGVRDSGIGYPHVAGDVNEGSYVYLTLLHEVGHLLGLNHPGNYNGTVSYLTDAVFWNDSKQYSLMSYMDEAVTGGDFLESAATPMLLDILAIQIEYGINWSTRAGDTTYGFNADSGVAAYAFTAEDKTGVFTIWDGAGNDTLDFSGFASDTVMDLRQGGFSSTGLETYNVAVAYHAVVENAVGGRGNDRIRGNDVGNILSGGAGEDVIFGGADIAAAATPDPRAFTGIGLNLDPLERGQYLSVMGLRSLSSPQFSVEFLVTLDRVPDSSAVLLSYAVPGNSNEFILEAGSGGNLRITIDGLARHETAVLTRSLTDGEAHRISVTWDSATGRIGVYVDGALAHDGTYADATGRLIAAGGTLVIGQEQDSLGGGFDAAQYLPGTIGDIRIFNDIRTADEIAGNAFATIAANTQGLVNNWRVAATDIGTVADAVTGGSALVVHGGAAPILIGAPVVAVPDDDRLIGGLGNDRLFGGAGNDTLSGHGGTEASFLAPMQGIAINEGADTTGYLAVSGYSGLSGANSAVQFSIEMAFQAKGEPAESYFLSYANSQSSNAILLGGRQDGNLVLTYRGGDMVLAVPTARLMDGAAHRLSLTWDGRPATQGFVLYLDGVEIARGMHQNQIWSLATGGTLIFGQDQDIIGGGFNPNQIFSGVIGDIRVFDHVLTPEQVASGAAAPLAGPVAGLVSHWQVTGTDAGSVADMAGGAPLTVAGGASVALLGHRDDDRLDGGEGHDSLSGDGGHDLLIGGAGNDTLDGGTGSDTLQGGAGDDCYFLSDALDIVTELAGEGLDRLYAAVDFILGNNAEIEELYVSDLAGRSLTGNGFSNRIVGAEGRDSLFGGGGADTLDGGAGIDSMMGGAGDDVYIVSTAGETVSEMTVPGKSVNAGGYDTVYSAVSFNLNSTPGVRFVEALVLTGTSNIHATGNGLANNLTGNSASNTLNGGLGADVLTGGAGRDRFVFSTALSATNVDRILDFSVVDDWFRLDDAVFTGLPTKWLAGTAFASNLTGMATDSSDRIIYETDTGNLYFDVDGSGTIDRILFATVDPNLNLTAADFFVF